MGYYIPNNMSMSDRGATEVQPIQKIDDVPADKALIVELDNGLFKANGLAYSQDELDEFNGPCGRPKRYFVMDKELAHNLSGYTIR